MSANDDDVGGDDDQLKQLRTVWVSMRESDDDPPDHGLDALMAAARTKAADMTPAPSEGFWAKVLTVFRRPPVLALASITVLLGGALFIAGRRDKMQSQETASDRQEQQGAPGAGATAPVTPDRGYEPTTPAASNGAAAVTPPPLEVAEPPPAEVTRTPVTTRPRPTIKPPAITGEKPTDAKKPAKPPKGDEGGEDMPIARPTVTDTATVGGLEQAAPGLVKVAPQSGTRGPVAKTPASSTEEVFGRSEAKPSMDNDEADSTTTDRRSKDTQVTQLVKQCESAAARKDCPAVRVLAKRIKSADADAYKQRVANNTAIARCLE